MLPDMDRKRLERQREAAQRELQEAERELDAATRLSEVWAAARKLNRARSELRWLDDAEKPKRRPTRGRGSEGDAS
jgi:hypothetical protein